MTAAGRRAACAAIAGAILLGACGGDGGGRALVRDDAVGEFGATSTTEPVATFTGDPNSEFCRRSREAAADPVADPFAAGLRPEEVELRFGALTRRFDRLAEAAPDALEDDLALLVEVFDEFRAALEAADFDFAALAEAGVDPAAFDDPRLAPVADRLAAYQSQVCEGP